MSAHQPVQMSASVILRVSSLLSVQIMQVAWAETGAETHPESVLPGTLEQLDHLERSSLLQDNGEPAFLSLSSTVTLQLRSAEQLRLARQHFLAMETSKLVKEQFFHCIPGSKTTLKGNVTRVLDKSNDSVTLSI